MSVRGQQRWIAGGGRRFGLALLWRQWENDPGDEAVVYDPCSGDTHVLDAVSAAALKLLEQSPLDLSQLVAQVAEQLGLKPDEELVRHMEQVLDRFDALGLIEPG